MNKSVNIIESVFGFFLNLSCVRRWVLPPETVNSYLVTSGLRELCNKADIDSKSSDPSIENTESPVFIFSAGWGSGSTLLQRLILSSGEVMIWGESFDEAAPIQRLAMTVSPFRPDWPPDYHFDHDALTDLSKAWVANLSPSITSYKNAHSAFIRSWLSPKNSAESGVRWGLKEVRLTIDHARYLKWLYPNAKFIFIYRDLHSCYRSCRSSKWIYIWPNFSATNILAFSHHWKHLIDGFIEGHQDVDGLMVKYEDLISDKNCIEQIRKYICVNKIDENIFLEKIGSIGGGSRGASRRPLKAYEKCILNSIAGKLRKELGYS